MLDFVLVDAEEGVPRGIAEDDPVADGDLFTLFWGLEKLLKAAEEGPAFIWRFLGDSLLITALIATQEILPGVYNVNLYLPLIIRKVL